jgi:hypothetical protein
LLVQEVAKRALAQVGRVYDLVGLERQALLEYRDRAVIGDVLDADGGRCLDDHRPLVRAKVAGRHGRDV